MRYRRTYVLNNKIVKRKFQPFNFLNGRNQNKICEFVLIFSSNNVMYVCKLSDKKKYLIVVAISSSFPVLD